jgi:hypothetical protein
VFDYSAGVREKTKDQICPETVKNCIGKSSILVEEPDQAGGIQINEAVGIAGG